MSSPDPNVCARALVDALPDSLSKLRDTLRKQLEMHYILVGTAEGWLDCEMCQDRFENEPDAECIGAALVGASDWEPQDWESDWVKDN